MGSSGQTITSQTKGLNHLHAEGYTYHYQGKKYIDAVSNSLFCPLGHHHFIERDSLKNATASQPDDVAHLSKLLSFFHPNMVEWHYTSSRSQAIELALMSAFEMRGIQQGKVAKRVLCLSGGYYGWTLGTGHFKYQFEHYRRPYEITEVPLDILTQDEIPTWLLETDFDAFILEPIQQLTGFGIGYENLRKISEFCDSNGSYLIVDESVTAFSRCGTPGFLTGVGNWADIVVVGEQMANGLPVATLGFSERIVLRDFSPEVGWPYHSHILCKAAFDILMWMKEYMDGQKFIDFAFRWVEEFEQLVEKGKIRCQGGLIHIDVGLKAKEIHNALFEEKGIITSYHTPWLMIAPCYTMPEDVHERIISSVKEIIKYFDKVPHLSSFQIKRSK